MKIIPVEKAITLAKNISKEACLTQKEETIFNLIMASVKPIEIEGKQFLSLDHLKNFLNNFSKAVYSKDYSWLTQRRGLKVNKFVDVEEFILSNEYLKQGGGQCRPHVLKKLIEFWENPDYIEVLLAAATGWGKGYFSRCSFAYIIYKLNCYYNPQLEFDLSLGSSIVLVQQSKKETLARNVLLNQFRGLIKESPYFIKYCQYDPNVLSELRFPNDIYVRPAGARDTEALGQDVWAVILDELNFFERTENSIHIKYSGEEEYDQAERAYSKIRRRIKSRFIQKGGKIPGRIFLISSINYVGDFTDRRKKEVEEEKKKHNKTHTFVISAPQWESIPKERLSEEVFFVEIGDEARRSRIIEKKEDAIEPEKVIEVPIDYFTEFERDLEGSLKDIANIVTGTQSPFIPYVNLIKKAQEKHVTEHNGQSLFLKESVFMSTMDTDAPARDWGEIINYSYIENEIVDPKNTVFAVHIDPGLNKNKGDAAGLAVGRIFGYKKLAAYKYYDQKKETFVEINDINAPIYHIDGALQIRARMNDEVDFDAIRDLILELKARINIKWATMDTYQSTQLKQSFNKAKIRSGFLSVDTSFAPATEYKLAIKDERIYLPKHSILEKETKRVQKGEKKIDHLHGEAKDCFDGVCGVVHVLQYKEANYRGERKGRRREKETSRIRKIRRSRMGIIK